MIIGIMGKKRSGKDTLAEMLVEDWDFEQFSFAEPMREFARDVFGWDDDWINNHKEEVDPYWGISYRQFMQNIGTEYFQYDLGKAFPKFKALTGRSIWVKRFIQHTIKHPETNFVISDVRFQHEADEIKKANGILLRVNRTNLEVDKKDLHASEIEADSIEADYGITNRGENINELWAELSCVMDEIGVKCD